MTTRRECGKCEDGWIWVRHSDQDDFGNGSTYESQDPCPTCRPPKPLFSAETVQALVSALEKALAGWMTETDNWKLNAERELKRFREGEK